MRRIGLEGARNATVVGLGIGLVALAVVVLAPHLPRWQGWALAALGTITVPLIEHLFSWLAEQAALSRARSEAARLEAIRHELASQKSSLEVARVLVRHLGRLSGARAVGLHFAADVGGLKPVCHGPCEGEPAVSLPLGMRERDLGEVRLFGAPRGGVVLRHAMQYGALAIHNALLAEAALKAEAKTADARTLRELQYWLTWTVSSQILKTLEESQRQLHELREVVDRLSSEHLGRDLSGLRERLAELERFVHANLHRPESASAA